MITDKEIDSIARMRGWIDYPSDSIEQGDTWHCDVDKAPFGKIISKESFRSHIRRIVSGIEEYPEVVEMLLGK